MNPDLPPFDDPAREREWQAQEHALDAERRGSDPAAGDARMRRYRLLARTLREPAPDPLPTDFARQMAAQVAATSLRRQVAGMRIESMLANTLVVLLPVAGGVMLALYGNTWLPAFHHLLPAPAANWLLALGGCIGASWLLGQWQRRVPATSN